MCLRLIGSVNEGCTLPCGFCVLILSVVCICWLSASVYVPGCLHDLINTPRLMQMQTETTGLWWLKTGVAVTDKHQYCYFQLLGKNNSLSFLYPVYHRIVGVGRVNWRCPGQPPAKAGSLQGADRKHPGEFVYLQRRRCIASVPGPPLCSRPPASLCSLQQFPV